MKDAHCGYVPGDIWGHYGKARGCHRGGGEDQARFTLFFAHSAAHDCLQAGSHCLESISLTGRGSAHLEF